MLSLLLNCRTGLVGIFLLGLAGVALGADGADGPREIYLKSAIATVTTGLQEDIVLRREIEYRRQVALIVSGASSTGKSAQIAGCAKAHLENAAARVRTRLDALAPQIKPTHAELLSQIAPYVAPGDRHRLSSASEDEIQDYLTKKLTGMPKGQSDVLQRILSCGVPKSDQDYLYCASFASKQMTAIFEQAANSMDSASDFHGCAEIEWHLRFGFALYACSNRQNSDTCEQATTASARRLDILYPLLSSMSANRPFPPNTFVEMVASDNTAKYEFQAGQIDGEGLEIGNERTVQTLFEHLAARIRKQNKTSGNKIKVISALPRMLDLPQNAAIRLVDVIDDPVDAISPLTPGPAKLFEMNDEIARARLRECVHFHAPGFGPQELLADVTKCAPYQLKSYDDLFHCINGGECMPDLAQNGLSAAISIAEPRKIDEIANNQMFPRLPSLEKVDSVVADCSDDKGTSQDCAQRIQQVVSGADLGSAQKEAQCIQGVVGGKVPGDCLPAATQKSLAAAQDALEVGRCFKEGDPAKCALKAAGVPPEFQDCVRKASTAAIAGCFPTGKLPPSVAVVAGVAGCVQQHTNDTGGLASCIVGSNINKIVPEKLRTAAQCVANSAGSGSISYGSALTCVAGSKLTPAQQIALQCLVQTGPGPQFFVCTGGRLFLGTLSACRNAKFGTDGCFGKGNELQRAAKALIGHDIPAKSVVGQVIIAPINAINGTLVAGESVARGAKHLGKELERQRERFDKAQQRVTENVYRQLVGKGVIKPLKWVGRKLRLKV